MPKLTAAEWIERDAANQWARYAEGKGRLLPAPKADDFVSHEEYTAALNGRRVLCRREHHEGGDATRLLHPDEYYPRNKECKGCTSREKKAKTATKITVYDTAEAWFAVAASWTSEKHPELEIGYCPVPKAAQFATTLEFERAVVLHKAHDKKYHAAIRNLQSVKDRENRRRREEYAGMKQTTAGRKALSDKRKRDNDNKKARRVAIAERGELVCPVGPHGVTEEELLFCPVEDLGMDDYKGTLGRDVRRGVCKKHFQKCVLRYRRHNAKPERKAYNKEQEIKDRVKAVRRKWKLDNRKRYNDTVNAHRRKTPALQKRRNMQSAAYRALPDNAFHIRIAQTKWAARTRGIAYKLSEEKEKELFSLDARCFYCDAAPKGVRPLGANQIDHSAKLLSDENVVACCKPCSFARGGLSVPTFLVACGNIVRFQEDQIANAEPIAYVMGDGTNDRGIHLHGTTYAELMRRAEQGNMRVEITKEEHRQMQYFASCYLCGLRAIPPTGSDPVGLPLGIDRYDNKEGYTRTNCRPCCTCCNMMKNTSSFENFVARCQRIVNKS